MSAKMQFVLTFVEKTRFGNEREFERTVRADINDLRAVEQIGRTMHDSFVRQGRVLLPGFDIDQRAF